MTLARPIATSFNGGELSPRMGGRVDTAIYAVGVEKAENFVPTVEGAIVKRPGFEFITASPLTASWLTEFRFNLLQDYVIEWSERKLRFYTNGVRIETSPGVPLEVDVPYTAAEAPFVSCQQSYDRIYMDHPAHPPGRLTRTGAATFVYDVAPLANGPFQDGNSVEATTVTVSGTTGSVTVTSSAPIFQAGHVGAFFRMEAADFSTVPVWQAGIDSVAIGDKKRWQGNVYQAATAGKTGTYEPVHTSGTEWDGMATGTDVNGKGPFGIKWTYLHDRFGVGRITAFGSATSVTMQVLRRLPDSLTSVPSFRWAHGAFSDAAGWPGVVVAFAGRLIHFKRSEMLASVAGDYLNHTTFTSAGLTAADLAFRRTLSSEDPVLWAIADRRIIAGTASREIAIGALNAQAALAGDNVEASPQSFYGSEAVFPVQIGTTSVFVQRSGRKLRQADYSFGQDRYTAQNMTVWCRHITRGGIRQLTFQKEPEELLVGVRGDGQLIVHPHAPEQEIKGFARIAHGGGKVLSAVAITASDGTADELWVLVRYPNGTKGVERMARWRDDDDPIETAFFVDSGTTAIAGIGQTHFSGATQLAGKAVAVLADGGVVEGVTVDATGAFDLPASVVPADRPYIVTVGLPYTATVVTLRPELGGQGNTSQGRIKRLVRLALRLLATSGLRLGSAGGRLDELIDRAASDRMDAAVPLFSGDTSRSVSGGYEKDGRTTFVSAAPLPATVVAAMPVIDASAN